MHTSTPQFIQLCKLLIQEMEQHPPDRVVGEKETILDRLVDRLGSEGIVFDRALSGQIFDQLLEEPELKRETDVEGIRNRVRDRDYFTDAMLETIGERLLWVLGNPA